MNRLWPGIARGPEPKARKGAAPCRVPAEGAVRPGHRPSGRSGPDGALASELDCLRSVLAPAVLQAATRRAIELGVGAERVLITRGVIDQDGYIRHLARHGGMAVETFAGVTRSDCVIADHHLVHAATHRILPLRRAGSLKWVIAPRGTTARHLALHLPGVRGARADIHLATTSDFDRFLLGEMGGPLARAAIGGLQRRFPEMSAAPGECAPERRGRRLRRAALVALPMLLAPALLVEAAGALAALGFVAFAALRIAAAVIPAAPSASRRLAEHDLPVYTVIAALYREATSVEPLLRAFDALDYPREKLDIKIVVERDDPATRAALMRARARRGMPPHLQVIVAPREGPRTKPKALVCALPFAHGSFVTVFDAEDHPEPDQLRTALDAFRRHGPEVACVQASLCIDNTRESWLARMFGVEYAGQFDAFLPGLAALGLPLPLGGSSNHFRTEVLRKVGGWDPYNVTEDADLGMRLARFGYRAVTIASTTFEEAPVHFGAWMRQRTRWMKGWMQTWIVHMSAPRRLWRDSGAAGWLTLNLLVGGNVLTALAHPLLLAGIALDLASRGHRPILALPDGAVLPLHVVAIAAGYIGTAVVGLIGLARRRRLRDGWILLLTPLYWLYLSCAAWRALYQLLTDPYRWEKTDHAISQRDTALHMTVQREAALRTTALQRPPATKPALPQKQQGQR